jgi:hypothetical protein
MIMEGRVDTLAEFPGAGAGRESFPDKGKSKGKG